ncbi:hypothetical protein ACFLWS_04035 [Chloroflexota bacterium]
MKRLIILASLAIVLLVMLALVAAYIIMTPRSAEDTDNITQMTVPEDDFQNGIENMKDYQEELSDINFFTPNPYYQSFLEVSDNFTDSIQDLREAVKNGASANASDSLNAVYTHYQSLSDSANRVYNVDITCNVLMFMEEADNSIETIIEEIEMLTHEIEESVSDLERMEDENVAVSDNGTESEETAVSDGLTGNEKIAICDNITTKNRELRRNHEELDEKRELITGLIPCKEIPQLTEDTANTSPPAGSEDNYQMYIENMHDYWTLLYNISSNLTTPDQNYENFLDTAQDFMGNNSILGEAVKNRNLQKIDGLLNTVNNQYQSTSDLADNTYNDGAIYYISMFMMEVEKPTRVVSAEVERLTQKIGESVSELEESANKTEAIRNGLTANNTALQKTYDDMEKQRASLQIGKWDEAKNILFHLALPIAASSVAGFIVLIPWYRKFAQEEEYWGFSVKKTGRISPVAIMMYIVIAVLTILIGYTAYEGYIGALL